MLLKLIKRNSNLKNFIFEIFFYLYWDILITTITITTAPIAPMTTSIHILEIYFNNYYCNNYSKYNNIIISCSSGWKRWSCSRNRSICCCSNTDYLVSCNFMLLV